MAVVRDLLNRYGGHPLSLGALIVATHYRASWRLIGMLLLVFITDLETRELNVVTQGRFLAHRA